MAKIQCRGSPGGVRDCETVWVGDKEPVGEAEAVAVLLGVPDGDSEEEGEGEIVGVRLFPLARHFWGLGLGARAPPGQHFSQKLEKLCLGTQVPPPPCPRYTWVRKKCGPNRGCALDTGVPWTREGGVQPPPFRLACIWLGPAPRARG